MFTAKEYAMDHGVCIDINSYLTIRKFNPPVRFVSAGCERELSKIMSLWTPSNMQMMTDIRNTCFLNTCIIRNDETVAMARAYGADPEDLVEDDDDDEVDDLCEYNLNMYESMAAVLIMKEVIAKKPGLKAMFIYSGKRDNVPEINTSRAVETLSKRIYKIIKNMFGPTRVLRIRYKNCSCDGVLILIDEAMPAFFKVLGMEKDVDPQVFYTSMRVLTKKADKITSVEIPMEGADTAPKLKVYQRSMLDTIPVYQLRERFLVEYGYPVELSRLISTKKYLSDNRFPMIETVLHEHIGARCYTLSAAYDNVGKLFQFIIDHANPQPGEYTFTPVKLKE